jgi:hypothetical protein
MSFKTKSPIILIGAQVISSIIFSSCQSSTFSVSNKSLLTTTTDILFNAARTAPVTPEPSLSCSVILPTRVSTLIPITKPNPPAGEYCESGVSYISKGGLTVTLDVYISMVCGEIYDVAIEYRLENHTIDKVLDEGRFKAYCKDGSGELQIALIGKLDPGQTATRSYVWRGYWNNVITVIEYEPDSAGSTPSLDTLKWKAPIS